MLSDPARRREFDSTDEFDDTLPTGCDPADFFKASYSAGGLPAHRPDGRAGWGSAFGEQQPLLAGAWWQT